MNCVKFLVALAALCVLAIPAFSMPDNGMGQDAKQMWHGQDDKQMPQGQDSMQKTCGCEKSMMGQDGMKMDHKNVKSMMGGKEKDSNSCVKLVVVNIKA
jgi:hypothetical protein